MKPQEDDRDRVDSIHLDEDRSSFPNMSQILSSEEQFSVNGERDTPANPFASEDDDDDDIDDAPVPTYMPSVRKPKTVAQIDLTDGKTKACDRNATFDSFVAHEKLATAGKEKSLSHNSQMIRGLRKIFRIGRRKR